MCPVVELAHSGEDPLQVAGQGARVYTIPNTKAAGKGEQSEARTVKWKRVSLTLQVVVNVHAGAGDRHADRRCAGGFRGSALVDLGIRVPEAAMEIRCELEKEIPCSGITSAIFGVLRVGWSHGPEHVAQLIGLVPNWFTGPVFNSA